LLNVYDTPTASTPTASSLDRHMSDVDPSRAGRSTPWHTTARRLLCNLSCSQSATPTSTDLADLHFALQQCESNQFHSGYNVGVIRNFLQDPNRKTQKQLELMSIYPPKAPVKYHFRYTSSLPVYFICDLSKHAPRYV
jgi:hypothetical protein